MDWLTGVEMEIYEIKDGLFQASAMDDLPKVQALHVGLIIDVMGRLDAQTAGAKSLLCWLIDDAPVVPDEIVLWRVAEYGFQLWSNKYKVLTHCAAGVNRSGLINGCILIRSGMTGQAAVALIRQRRPGALTNQTFANYLQSFPRAVWPKH